MRERDPPHYPKSHDMTVSEAHTLQTARPSILRLVADCPPPGPEPAGEPLLDLSAEGRGEVDAERLWYSQAAIHMVLTRSPDDTRTLHPALRTFVAAHLQGRTSTVRPLEDRIEVRFLIDPVTEVESPDFWVFAVDLARVLGLPENGISVTPYQLREPLSEPGSFTEG